MITHFVLGMPNMNPILEINNISSLSQESLDFTKEEVLDFSEAIVKLSDRIDFAISPSHEGLYASKAVI